MKIKRKSRRKWLTGYVAGSLLAFALAVGAIAAVPVIDGAAKAVDFDKSCSLNIHPGGGEYAEDVADANVVVDLYQVADAMPVAGYDTYTYSFLGDYKGLTVSEYPDNAEWEALAQQAAGIAFEKGNPDRSGLPVNKAAEGLGCGLYLAIARGNDIADYKITVEDADGGKKFASVAYSKEHKYTFAPCLVSLPSKEADEDGVISTAGDGSWIYDMEVTLKPEQALRYGSVEIVKRLSSYETKDPATFVFSVEATLGEEVVYSDVVSLSFTEPGEKKVLLDRIPVSAKVTVTEVYSGAAYDLVTDPSQTVVVEAEEVASASFTNDYNDTHKGGGSVTNHFEYDSDTGWGWTQIPDEE